ncbi:hypothetical protein EW026_g8124 [Hermanssonia centrifuga]|uniref:3-demethoxyubiquinol 3-hydroxylase n=1 Tax=Hermanssonia centrifuga TaxID=98765 RepID=A0A4S4K5F6_9APHY|nr:hypothetical protein EW026_g8124 [Hermanssonia centrifuga]
MSRTLPSAAYTDPGRTQEASTSGTSQDITKLQKDTLDAALRVDQAGEVAANYIYMGQLAVLGRDRTVGPLIQHRVRPTILWQVAKVAGFGLGALTALMGKEAAMACTEAVETVIGEHYDDQLKELNEMKSSHPSISLLKDVIREFRDDELEHLDTAVEYHSQRAPAHALLSTVVGGGCKMAIELCKRF